MANTTGVDGGLEPFPSRSPFYGMKISSHDLLRATQHRGRQPCPVCQCSRLFFCYRCRVNMVTEADTYPIVALPLAVDIIKHRGEKDSKSTAIHSLFTSPEHVSLYTYPDFPDSYNPHTTLLLYPAKDAIPLAEVPDLASIKKVVLIDCTWAQAGGMLADKRFKDLKRVTLQPHKTNFWRVQKGHPDTCLATIEALYWLCKEYSDRLKAQATPQINENSPDKPEDSGNYDNLLYLYSFMHSQVQANHSHQTLPPADTRQSHTAQSNVIDDAELAEPISCTTTT